MSDLDNANPTVLEEGAKFLERDFNQCFSMMRHYDAQVLEICKFAFTAYTALAAGAIALYQFSINKQLDLVPAACIALAISLSLGFFLFALAVRNRVYFVVVARYINEHRQLFLSSRPLGFQNISRMYTNPSQPPFFNWRSSQLCMIYIIAALNSTLLGLLLFFVFHDYPCRWYIVGIGVGVLLLVQLVAAVFYLRSREAKTGQQAVFGKKG